MDDQPLEQLNQEFKLALRRMTSTVSLVTTQVEGKRFGMAATAVVSVSADPATILVCVNHNASICGPIKMRGRFAINMLHVSHAEMVAVFSDKAKVESRFEYGDWSADKDMPVLKDAQASLVCDVIHTHTVNTHEVVFGRVIAVQHRTEVAPLLYEDGKLAQSTPLLKQSA